MSSAQLLEDLAHDRVAKLRLVKEIPDDFPRALIAEMPLMGLGALQLAGWFLGEVGGPIAGDALLVLAGHGNVQVAMGAANALAAGGATVKPKPLLGAIRVNRH